MAVTRCYGATACYLIEILMGLSLLFLAPTVDTTVPQNSELTAKENGIKPQNFTKYRRTEL